MQQQPEIITGRHTLNKINTDGNKKEERQGE